HVVAAADAAVADLSGFLIALGRESRELLQAGGEIERRQAERGLIEAVALRDGLRMLAKEAVTEREECGGTVRAGEVKNEILGAAAAVAIRKGVSEAAPQHRWHAVAEIQAVARHDPLLVADVVVDLDIHLVAFAHVYALREEIVGVGEGV